MMNFMFSSVALQFLGCGHKIWLSVIFTKFCWHFGTDIWKW